MPSSESGNLLVAQGGGPTPVINCTLYGVIREAAKHPRVGRILGARFGVKGCLKEDLVDLGSQASKAVEDLRRTPGAALGSCRYRVTQEDCARMLKVMRKQGVRYFLYIGGNDSMDTAERVHLLANDRGHELFVIGVPKTIDNDLPITDRCPGYGSAARYVAQSVRDVGTDIRSLPTPVSIFETMGRNTGWLAGSSALARTDPESAPHLIYLPERPFDPPSFLSDLEDTVKRLGWALVVVSEGLKQADGKAVHECGDSAQLDAFGHRLPGDVGTVLAALVYRELGLRCRSEKPGIIGRTSMYHVSPVDQEDAECVGRAAVRAALSHQSGQMITLLPLSESSGGPETGLVPLVEVANHEKRVPSDWIDPSGSDVAAGFCDYVRPLLGPDLLEYGRLD